MSRPKGLIERAPRGVRPHVWQTIIASPIADYDTENTQFWTSGEMLACARYRSGIWSRALMLTLPSAALSCCGWNRYRSRFFDWQHLALAALRLHLNCGHLAFISRLRYDEGLQSVYWLYGKPLPHYTTVVKLENRLTQSDWEPLFSYMSGHSETWVSMMRARLEKRRAKVGEFPNSNAWLDRM